MIQQWIRNLSRQPIEMAGLAPGKLKMEPTGNLQPVVSGALDFCHLPDGSVHLGPVQRVIPFPQHETPSQVHTFGTAPWGGL